MSQCEMLLTRALLCEVFKVQLIRTMTLTAAYSLLYKLCSFTVPSVNVPLQRKYQIRQVASKRTNLHGDTESGGKIVAAMRHEPA